MEAKLSHLIKNLEVLEVIGEIDKNIVDLQSDSRKARKEGLFVAVRGVNTDGHKYIPVVASTHVGAIVCEDLPASLEKDVTYIRVPNSAIALGILASNWYGNPSSRLKLVGVTGTNGKTTTATLLYEMAKLEGYKAGLISTVCNYVHERAVPATHTTPDPITLNALLAEMVETGCDYAFMEVSSHAAHQHRIAGLTFAGGVFSNLTRDHLDYHGTVENYMNAKKMFFDMLPAGAFALVNADDKAGAYMLQNTKAKKYT
ncbi:MAG: UDP-N-acetylmuramoyl-L-alanyl-D-glutamate--2,6-diaminopimelate ligase, partial [Muribaculaceae bacterium]|nr:UDP-N-acetylmuramoyl-L-alanyl-D-glutamate--2,6-diaminopimelate ligase [Muribaculaceae bacterium]